MKKSQSAISKVDLVFVGFVAISLALIGFLSDQLAIASSRVAVLAGSMLAISLIPTSLAMILFFHRPGIASCGWIRVLCYVLVAAFVIIAGFLGGGREFL